MKDNTAMHRNLPVYHDHKSIGKGTAPGSYDEMSLNPTLTAFSNAPRSLSVWACVRWALTREPYGAFDHFVARGVLVNASTINLRH